jgi:GNAT superfamily N-acetyltransferase
VEIRAYTAADAAACAALAAAGWPGDAWMAGQHGQHSRALAAYVALDGGTVVGAASARREAWHPHKLELVGTVAAAHRRRGLGTALLARLGADLPGEWLRSRTPAGDREGLAFLRARGFAEVMRCRVVRIAPGAADAWCDRIALPDGFHLDTDRLDTDSLDTDRLDTDSARALCYRIYAEGHADNPPDMSPDDWIEAFFDARPDPLMIAYAGGTPVGLVHGSVAGSDLDLMPSGVLAGSPDEVYRALFAWLLRWAAARGLTVDAEVDDADRPFAAMIDELTCEVRYDLRHLELAPDSGRTVG